MTRVVKLLAPNPGPYTGPGTNTYVLVDQDECVVIDPGPVINTHRAAIVETIAALQPTGIVVTHTHPDHAPLANPLGIELEVPVYGYAPGPDFDPDRTLRDGQAVRFGRTEARVIYTPGHASDHICLAVGDTLFTGDHIMGGSTVVIEDLAAYLDSLRRLQHDDWSRLYPGHGPEIEEAAALIQEYIDHRLERERQILDALRGGAGSVGEIVGVVYADVNRALHPIAAHSVAAHLNKLAAEGRVRWSGRRYLHGESGLWDEPVMLADGD